MNKSEVIQHSNTIFGNLVFAASSLHDHKSYFLTRYNGRSGDVYLQPTLTLFHTCRSSKGFSSVTAPHLISILRDVDSHSVDSAIRDLFSTSEPCKGCKAYIDTCKHLEGV